MYRGEEKRIHALPRFAVREKFIYLASERPRALFHSRGHLGRSPSISPGDAARRFSLAESALHRLRAVQRVMATRGEGSSNDI